jgi:hypothetical protein
MVERCTMTESTSKIVLGIEAILLVLPVGGLLVIFVPWVLTEVRSGGSMVSLGIAIASIVPFLAGVWLMLGFWLHGASGIRGKRRHAWTAAHVGAALVIVATIVTVIAVFVPGLRGVAEVSALFMFGLPLLIPLMHLSLESIHRRPAIGAQEIA